MPNITPNEMAGQLGTGLLSFPVTHFRNDLSFDEAAYRDNLNRLAGYDVAGLFAAGGTGEFFSLTPTEVEQIVRASVEETQGRVLQLPTSLTSRRGRCSYGFLLCLSPVRSLEVEAFKGLSTEGPTLRGKPPRR